MADNGALAFSLPERSIGSSTPSKRQTAREAAAFVAGAIASKVEAAGHLEKQLRRASAPALSEDERKLFDEMLDAAGLSEAWSTFLFTVQEDPRLLREGPGRRGAPARDNMRAAVFATNAIRPWQGYDRLHDRRCPVATAIAGRLSCATTSRGPWTSCKPTMLGFARSLSSLSST